jgi:peptidoglycan/xylan/chitin deacetylase (PgdA/CDA1 family)
VDLKAWNALPNKGDDPDSVCAHRGAQTCRAKYNFGMLGLGVLAAAAAACGAGYQSMAPTGQWCGRTFTGMRGRSQLLALTYDDGPNEAWTPALLDLLAKHEISASFFLIGRYVRQRPELARRVVQAGHTVGNHTYSHPLLIFQPEAAIRSQVQGAQAAIADAVGFEPVLFRPPFGGRRPGVLRTVRELGLQTVMWNVTSYDWNARSAEEIEQKVAGRVTGGDVVLLHDGGHLAMGADRSRTVAATERLIARYKARGVQFVSLPEMMTAAARPT